MRRYFVFSMIVFLLAGCAGQSLPPAPTAQPKGITELAPAAAETQLPVKNATSTPSHPSSTAKFTAIPLTPASGQTGSAKPSKPATGSARPSTPATASQPWSPQPGDERMTRGNAFVDSAVIVPDSNSLSGYSLELVGQLPSPCNELRIVVSPPDSQSRIDVEVYSLAEPGKACILVLEPFEALVPLAAYTPGATTVYVNGEPVLDIQ